ncbi:MAG: hypothetical protein ACREA8_00320 [Nitrosotalea sp.]
MGLLQNQISFFYCIIKEQPNFLVIISTFCLLLISITRGRFLLGDEKRKHSRFHSCGDMGKPLMFQSTICAIIKVPKEQCSQYVADYVMKQSLQKHMEDERYKEVDIVSYILQETSIPHIETLFNKCI